MDDSYPHLLTPRQSRGHFPCLFSLEQWSDNCFRAFADVINNFAEASNTSVIYIHLQYNIQNVWGCCVIDEDICFKHQNINQNFKQKCRNVHSHIKH